MKRVRYLIKVFRGASLQKLAKVIDRIHQKTHKSKVFLFFDILYCAIRFGAGYNDYLIFAFYDMNHAQRKTYVTRIINKKLINMLNSQSQEYWFDRKDMFNLRFSEYLGRDSLDIKSSDEVKLSAFIKDKKMFFAKPNVGECGKGIERLKPEDYKDVSSLYQYIKNKNFGVLEEAIEQHDALSALYPFAVNTLRIVTLVAKNTPHCIYAVVKAGNTVQGSESFVDNLESGGVCAPLDPKTGKITGVGHTSLLINYTHHPYSGIEFIGYPIPFVPEAVELCLRAAMEIPEIRYVGWDVAITQNGPVIVEGNCHPGYDFW